MFSIVACLLSIMKVTVVLRTILAEGIFWYLILKCKIWKAIFHQTIFIIYLWMYTFELIFTEFTLFLIIFVLILLSYWCMTKCYLYTRSICSSVILHFIGLVCAIRMYPCLSDKHIYYRYGSVIRSKWSNYFLCYETKISQLIKS